MGTPAQNEMAKSSAQCNVDCEVILAAESDALKALVDAEKWPEAQAQIRVVVAKMQDVQNCITLSQQAVFNAAQE